MRKLISILVVLLSAQVVFGQNGLPFYHMRNTTPQGNHMNPTYFPDAKFYVSLPGISGISLNLDNAFGYDDVFSDIANSDSVLLDADKLLGKISDGDYLNFNASLSLFQFGIRLGDKSALNFFANERILGSLAYPKSLLEYAWEGNGTFVGQTFRQENMRASITHFREIGFGYSQKIDIGSSTLTLGGRIKTLQGNIHVGTSDNLAVDVLTREERLDLNISIEDPTVFTAGVKILEDDDDVEGYLISNSNRGIGFDLGAEFELNDKLSFAMSINDIGSITWKEGVRNYELGNTIVDYAGLDLRNLDDVGQLIEDTLKVLFDYDTTFNSFKTSLSPRTFISASYKVLPKSTVSASFSNLFILGQANTIFGIGFTQSVGKVLTASATISKQTGQSVAFGGGFAARFGFFQLYSSFDNLLGYTDVSTLSSTDFRFGINFLFGRAGKRKKKEKEKVYLPLLDDVDPEEESEEGVDDGGYWYR